MKKTPPLLILFLLITWVTQASAEKTDSATEAPFSVMLPVTFQNVDLSLGEPIFGVQVYGDTTESNPYFDPLIQSQATWVRGTACWSCAVLGEGQPPVYDWQTVDRYLKAAAHPQLEMIATIQSAPRWAAPHPNGVIYPEHMADLAAYAHAVVERYDGDGIDDAPGSPVVRYWEFYNEPDASESSWMHGWGEHGDQYAEMLRTVYPAIKSASTNAQVVFGGIAYDRFVDQQGDFVREFLDEVLISGGGEYFDIMNFHYYPVFGPNWTGGEIGPGLSAKTTFLRRKLNQYGVNKPFVITEAGWHSDGEGSIASSPEIQARHVASLLTQSLASDIQVMIWWMLYDPPDPYLDNGLVTDEPEVEKKPAFTAFQVIEERLGRAHFEQTLGNEVTGVPEMQAHQFTNNESQKTIYVAWMEPVETVATHPLRLPAAQATVYNLYGASQQIHDGDDGQVDGHVTVTVSGQAVYVEVDW